MKNYELTNEELAAYSKKAGIGIPAIKARVKNGWAKEDLGKPRVTIRRAQSRSPWAKQSIDMIK